MNEKKIEPTDAMVEAGASSAWEEVNPGILGWNSISERHKEGCRRDARAVLTAALNHPDAPGLFADEDALRAAREQGWDQAVDWIRGDEGGPSGRTINARLANPYRPAPTLPTNPATVIVTNGGCDSIEAVVSGVVWRTREAILSSDGRWHGVWRAGSVAVGSTSADSITLDTWKADEK